MAFSIATAVNVVLPASGCEMIAKVRRRPISSLRLLINPFQLIAGRRLFRRAHPRYTSGGYYGSRPLCQRLPLRTQFTSFFAGRIQQGAIPVAAAKVGNP